MRSSVPFPNKTATSTSSRTLALECLGLRKTYLGEQKFALGEVGDGLSFSVSRGELFALVGPSGCGKTTTLQIIGGFVPPDAGTIIIDGVDVTRSAPYARPTNTVFQSYALFPHMSVGANVGFGLLMERVGRRERQARVAEALELVGLAGFERRRISELSGGQQQRAALARAIIKRPTVLLLDEPLGALDLKLRKQMQDELVRLKKSTAITFIHVTHDQEEACAIADRIGVMKDGELVQVDEPFVLYRSPRNAYVAGFLDVGTIIRGRTVRHANFVEIVGTDFAVRAPARERDGAGPLAAVLPPDKVHIVAGDISGNSHTTSGTVARVVFTGTGFLAYVTLGSGLEVKVSLTVDEIAALDQSTAVGSRVGLAWDPENVILVEDR